MPYIQHNTQNIYIERTVIDEKASAASVVTIKYD